MTAILNPTPRTAPPVPAPKPKPKRPRTRPGDPRIHSPAAQRLAVLAAVARWDGDPTRGELERATASWACRSLIFRQTDLMLRDGLLERYPAPCRNRKGQEYRYRITAAGRALAPAEGTPEEILRAHAAADRDRRIRDRRDRVRAATLGLIADGVYPSGAMIASRLAGPFIHHSDCADIRNELEDAGELPGREDWPDSAFTPKCLPCSTYAERRRIWRRAAILRARAEGKPRPSGRTWVYDLEPEPETETTT